jgi:hypothetical protein
MPCSLFSQVPGVRSSRPYSSKNLSKKKLKKKKKKKKTFHFLSSVSSVKIMLGIPRVIGYTRSQPGHLSAPSLT